MATDMARKKKDDGFLQLIYDLLMISPWWSGPIFAALCYFLLKLVLPSAAGADTPAGEMLRHVSRILTPVFVFVVLLIWVITLGHKAYRRFLFNSAGELDSIRSLSWRDFELLVGEALRQEGYSVEENGGSGSDGGIDLVAHRKNETFLVQCKHWKARTVGVPIAREMFGLMISEKAAGVLIVTTGSFSREAQSFASGKPMRLIDGQALAKMIARVKAGKTPRVSHPMVEVRSEQPSESPVPPAEPVCPQCGAPMVLRTARRGRNGGSQFLGCSTFPKCRGTMDLPPSPP
jgi:restriction system protein